MPPKRSGRSPPFKRIDSQLSDPSDPTPVAEPPSHPTQQPHNSPARRADESITIFPNASGFVLNHPKITPKVTNKNTINFQSRNVGLDYLLPYVCPGAAVDSSERDPPPRCHPGTREEMQKRMSIWFDNIKRGGNLIWLTGPAGTGKSAVAQTFAELCASNARLGAAFFFSRTNERDKPSTVIPTLAYQIGLRFPDYRTLLMDRIAYDPTVLHKTPRTQFKNLIIEPFSILQLREDLSPLLVLLDGLDECNSILAQCEFVEMIGEAVGLKKGLPLLWLICSRPEPHLRHIFSRPHFVVDCLREELAIDNQTRTDVNRYLRDSFTKLRDDFPDTVNPSWPSEIQFDKVSKISSGLFVLASTIMKYIGEPHIANPMTRLAALLEFMRNAYQVGAKNPLKALDMFYSNIVADIPNDVLPLTKRILAFHLAIQSSRLESLPIRTFCNLLNVNRNDFYAALRNLHSVLDVPVLGDAPEGRLQFYHASFQDYLTNSTRSGKFAVDLDKARTEVATLCPFTYEIDGNTIQTDTSSLDFSTKTSENHILNLLQARILNCEDLHQTLLEVNGYNAQRILNILQRLLSGHLAEGAAKQSILAAFLRISVVSGLFPQGLVLQDINHSLLSVVHRSRTRRRVKYKGEYQGRQVYLKTTKLTERVGSFALRPLFQEAAILSELSHPNILPFYGVYHKSNNHEVGMVLPWMENGNLREYLKAHPGALRLPLVHDISAGVQYLHQHQVVYNHLCGEHIIIKDDGSACLADFKISSTTDPEVLKWASFLSPSSKYAWQAPEIPVTPKVGPIYRPQLASDIYSLACTMLEIFTGEDPFHEVPAKKLLTAKRRGVTPNMPNCEVAPELTDHIWDVMQHCWSLQPSDRPTIDEVIPQLPARILSQQTRTPNEDWLWRPSRPPWTAAEMDSDKMFLMNFFHLD